MRFTLKYILVGLAAFLHSQSVLHAQSQDCTLDIAGKDVDVIIQIFQLNADQRSMLEMWRKEVLSKTEVLEGKMKKLLEEHPQSNETDLRNLSKKYATLKEKLMLVSMEYDQKLLGVFNDKQYAYYSKLCTEALRKPLNPILQEEEKE